MFDYWITFQIAESGEPDRHDALIEAINTYGTGFWQGPSGFICMSSEYTIDALGETFKLALKPAEDLLIIREIGKNKTRVIGDPGPGFEAFFPNTKSL